MPTDALPTAAIWDGYAVAGIVFIVILVMVALVWKGFKEYRAWQTMENQSHRDWQDMQFKLRETENERQRAFNEQMEAKRQKEAADRDQQMRAFMSEQQAKQIAASKEQSTILNSLVTRMDTVTTMISMQTAAITEQSKTLQAHDQRVNDRLAQHARAKTPRKTTTNVSR
jgi:formiminotetrahydrofolate cyclodeaminase